MFCKKCKALINDTYNFCPACGKETSPKTIKYHRRPKGSGSISMLTGNRNKPFRAVKSGICLGTFATEKEASLFLLQQENKTITKLNNITLLALWEKYKETDKYTNLSDNAKTNYNAAWKRLAHLSIHKVTDLKALEYQSCIEKVKEQGVGRDTCEKVRSLISNLCQFAIKLEITSKNYAETLELPQKVGGTMKRNFTDEEILTLFYNDHDDTAKIILCLLYTGVRKGELFQMLKENVHLKEQYMTGGLKTDSGKNRTIPIRSEISEYIEYFYNKGDSIYLISNAKGEIIDNNNFLKRDFYPLLDKLKINYKNEDGNNVLTPHRTRHTYIAESIKAGVKPEILSKVVGHANYATSVDKYNKYVDIDYLLSQIQKGM